MIHNDVLNQLQLLVKTSAPPLVDVAQTPLDEPLWVPGQRLSAVVLSTMPNGRFQVQVGDHVLDMNLPKNTLPGEQLELTFVSNQPRLTFVLSRDLAAALPNAAVPADVKPQVNVSDSARYLGALLQKISDQAEAQTAPLSKTAPVLSAAPSDIKEFAASLRNTLSQSGLFYESHQAQWVAGDRKLADLLLEPQGRLSTVRAGLEAFVEAGQKGQMLSGRPDAASALSFGREAAAMASSLKDLPPLRTDVSMALDAYNSSAREVLTVGGQKGGGAPNAPDAPIVQGAANNAGREPVAESGQRGLPVPSFSDTSAIQNASRQPVHADTVSLVQQQLHALDSRQLVWQGQVWQGQSMDWRVEERSAREGGNGGDELPHWQTSLRLKLPRMGNIQASLAFLPQGLRVNLWAASEGTAGAMKDAQGKLQNSLEASGLKVMGLTVERNEKA